MVIPGHKATGAPPCGVNSATEPFPVPRTRGVGRRSSLTEGKCFSASVRHQRQLLPHRSYPELLTVSATAGTASRSEAFERGADTALFRILSLGTSAGLLDRPRHPPRSGLPALGGYVLASGH